MHYTAEMIDEHERRGMASSFWAREKPSEIAVRDCKGSRTFAEVNANANRIVRLLRNHGVVAGDHIAFVSSNRCEVVEILAAAMRGGYRLVPVNWHFTESEASFVFTDSDAKAIFVETKFPAAIEASRDAGKAMVRLSIGDDAAEGHLPYAAAIAEFDGRDIPDPVLGNTMFYTSGTTGRPKGVYRPNLELRALRAFEHYDCPNPVQLCAGPLYHGAPLTLETRTAMVLGVPLVYLERFEALEVLQTIEDQKITHMHMVPIMMQRLLALSPDRRKNFDLSSLTFINHGAAPCPRHVKKSMIDWLGPIFREYYGGSEGGAGFAIDSHEWLAKPGSVGKRPQATLTRIIDEAGQECPPGIPGTIYFQRSPSNPFEYYNDPEKTRHAHRGDLFTLGDIGYFDEDDFLFLTGRSADCIISGGVNIYPQEIDDVLSSHPAISDVAVIGVPNEEWGEEVKAVIVLQPGLAPSPGFSDELMAFARQNLAGYKMPRSIDYVAELPRNAAGKIERSKIRARYWTGRKIAI